MIASQKLPVRDIQFWRKEKMLILAIHEKKFLTKPVPALSNAHTAAVSNCVVKGKNKPKSNIIFDYNSFRGGVDFSDKKVYHYAAVAQIADTGRKYSIISLTKAFWMLGFYITWTLLSKFPGKISWRILWRHCVMTEWQKWGWNLNTADHWNSMWPPSCTTWGLKRKRQYLQWFDQRQKQEYRQQKNRSLVSCL